MKAMILAAGLGTRLRPYSEHTPKALFTINEQPVLALTIEKLNKAGFEAIMINTHHHHRQIKSYLADNDFAIPVRIRHEKDILGTGGGIRNIADFWENGSLLVINADIVCDIDLAKIYAFHQRHPYPVTMVMHNYERFNAVSVDANHFIVGFQGGQDRPGSRKLAFTGIHVIDRQVLDYLPAQGRAHIIEAYQKMIAADSGIKAYMAEGHRWYDIGTPKSYQAAVYDHLAPQAFKTAFGNSPSGTIQKQKLPGDGSNRQWYRLRHAEQSLILVDHGIRSHKGVQEVDAYIAIGQHLRSHQVAVPHIYAYDCQAGMVINEDMGDTHLQTLVQHKQWPQIQQLYQQVIDKWIIMAIEGQMKFDTNWAYQTPYFDSELVMKNECRYFSEAFVQTYLGWEPAFDRLRPEFEKLAKKIMETEIRGFIHRDFQSRNIMVRNGQVGFIDFQGGRLGPIQYDLASLLIDPYAGLTAPMQSELLDYAIEKLTQDTQIDPDLFLKGYTFCTVSRNLQILGAFAFLSRNKGKVYFEAFIPKAVKSLVHNLSCLKGLSLPKLKKLTDRVLKNTVRKHNA